MAASMRKAFLLRSFLRNIPHRCGCKRNVPLASYCVESQDSNRRLKVNVGDLIDDSDLLNISGPAADASENDLDDVGEEQSFATMFRESRFVQLGDLRNKRVAGRIVDIVNNDLYIDFGGKFSCVCARPTFEAENYVRGQRVEVLLHQFEMSSSFLDNPQHVTLLEADCTLLGLFHPLLIKGQNERASNVRARTDDVRASDVRTSTGDISASERSVRDVPTRDAHADEAQTNEVQTKAETIFRSRVLDIIDNEHESSVKNVDNSKENDTSSEPDNTGK